MTLTRVPATCLGLALCVVTGALVTGPLAPIVGLALGGLTALAGIRLAQARAKVPLVALLVLALFGGYLVLNRNFAELHLPFGSLPVYVGELTLVVTLPWVLSSRTEFQRLTRDPFFVALLAWQAYCAGRLLAGGLDYGIDALRDSAIWYYGLYAIVGYVLWPLVPRGTWVSFFALAFVGFMIVSASFAAVGPPGMS